VGFDTEIPGIDDEVFAGGLFGEVLDHFGPQSNCRITYGASLSWFVLELPEIRVKPKILKDFKLERSPIMIEPMSVLKSSK
jgi:hypothetical protein